MTNCASRHGMDILLLRDHGVLVVPIEAAPRKSLALRLAAPTRIAEVHEGGFAEWLSVSLPVAEAISA